MREKRLKATITACKPHFLQKVIQFRQTLNDGVDGRFRSSLHVFIPKLSIKHQKPCVMLWCGNGNGKCLIRLDDPQTLADKLRQLADIVMSDIWKDIWIEINDISELIQFGEYDDPNSRPLVEDHKFIDF